MLVLARHTSERIFVGDDIVITVVELRGDKVRLGIDAPGDIPVHREEVYREIKGLPPREPEEIEKKSLLERVKNR